MIAREEVEYSSGGAEDVLRQQMQQMQQMQRQAAALGAQPTTAQTTTAQTTTAQAAATAATATASHREAGGAGGAAGSAGLTSSLDVGVTLSAQRQAAVERLTLTLTLILTGRRRSSD
jgi:hypothetical protein